MPSARAIHPPAPVRRPSTATAQAPAPTPTDWPPDTIATGFWLRVRAASRRGTVESPTSRASWLREQPPIYVGFGSSVGPDLVRLGAVVTAALQGAGIRAGVVRGWGGLSGLRAGLAGDGDRAGVTPLAVPACCRGRASRRRRDHSRGAARRASDDRASVPGRPALLGRGGSPCRRGPEPCRRRSSTPERLAAAIQPVHGHAAMQRRAAELSQPIAAGKRCGTGFRADRGDPRLIRGLRRP